MSKPTDSMKEKLTGPLAGLTGCFVAGGAITSLHTNKPIADFDIYPKSLLARDEAIAWAFGEGWWCVATSRRALTFARGEERLQIMIFDTFETSAQIFEAFDFTCCMGAFDLDTQKFSMHRHFLLHCAQRFLLFNPKTRFPYASVMRVRKYEEKGFTIGKAEFYKILLACAASPITSWDELKEQIGGVYGESIVIPEGKPFSMDAAFEALNSLKFAADPAGYANAEEAIALTSQREIPYFEVPPGSVSTARYFAKLFDKSNWEAVGAPPLNGRLASITEVYPGLTFWKKVKRDGEGRYRSMYHSAFVYELGKEASAASPHLYAYETIAQARNHNSWNSSGSGHAILELRAEPEDIIFDPTQPRLKRCRVVAEHPVELTEADKAELASTNEIPF